MNTVNNDENEQIANRRAKLDKLRSEGFNYPNDFKREQLTHELHQRFDSVSEEELIKLNFHATIAGRLVAKRKMGKAAFAKLLDMSGSIQLYIRKDELGEEVYAAFNNLDLGDVIGVQGQVFCTQTGELTIRVANFKLLSKALLPLPEKYHGLVDRETRCRQRYLDLIANPKSREIFKLRSSVVAVIREFFAKRGFIEVETPMMHSIPGGATARPFITHHNTYDTDLYLRVAPELYLKRLVVGGFEKVFELNRCFRNEGISVRHNPEFTTIEFYEAYSDYTALMNLTEQLLSEIAQRCLGTTTITYQGSEIDLGKPFRRFTMQQAIQHFYPELKGSAYQDKKALQHVCETNAIKLPVASLETISLERIQYEIYDQTVEKQLIEPTFVTGYPAEVSPLARLSDRDPKLVDRFELIIAGRELANAFSELNDPDDQAERFKAQAKALADGDDEAMHYDADYITALQYGLPPTAGEGIGIDRLVMLLADAASIRDVILFPLLRDASE